jgi:hypothetical protein
MTATTVLCGERGVKRDENLSQSRENGRRRVVRPCDPGVMSDI